MSRFAVGKMKTPGTGRKETRAGYKYSMGKRNHNHRQRNQTGGGVGHTKNLSTHELRILEILDVLSVAPIPGLDRGVIVSRCDAMNPARVDQVQMQPQEQQAEVQSQEVANAASALLEDEMVNEETVTLTLVQVAPAQNLQYDSIVDTQTDLFDQEDTYYPTSQDDGIASAQAPNNLHDLSDSYHSDADNEDMEQANDQVPVTGTLVATANIESASVHARSPNLCSTPVAPRPASGGPIAATFNDAGGAAKAILNDLETFGSLQEMLAGTSNTNATSLADLGRDVALLGANMDARMGGLTQILTSSMENLAASVNAVGQAVLHAVSVYDSHMTQLLPVVQAIQAQGLLLQQQQAGVPDVSIEHTSAPILEGGAAEGRTRRVTRQRR